LPGRDGGEIATGLGGRESDIFLRGRPGWPKSAWNCSTNSRLRAARLGAFRGRGIPRYRSIRAAGWVARRAGYKSKDWRHSGRPEFGRRGRT